MEGCAALQLPDALPLQTAACMHQGKNDEVLKAARAAKRGCELAPATPPEGLEIATVAGALLLHSRWEIHNCVPVPGRCSAAT